MKSRFMPVAVMALAILLPLCMYYGCFVPSPSEMRISLWNWIYSNAALLTAFILTLFGGWMCRKRSVPLLWSSKTAWLLVLYALVWGTLFNYFIVSSWPQVPFSIMFLLSMWSIGRALLGRFAFVVWVPCLFVLLLEYAATWQGFIINSENLMQVFATSWHDAQTYMTWGYAALALLALALSFCAYYLVHCALRHESRWTLLCSGCLSFTLLLVGVRPLEHSLWRGSSLIWPLGDMEVLAFHSVRAQYLMHQMKKVLSLFPPENSTEATMDTITKDAGVLCIIHVGESLCADHLPMNGYGRNTTPWLSSRENLINFPDCVASASTTDKAVITMLTNGRRNFMETKDKRYLSSSASLLDFFSACGFRCSSFLYGDMLSAQADGLFDKELRLLLRCSKENYIIDGKAWNQIPAVNEHVEGHPGENLCILLNNFGSHAFFDEYDTSCAPFVPTRPTTPDDAPETSPEDAEICTNAYDNTICYTDEYIRRLLDSLKGRPYLYVYMSDHGEYVGQGGYWLRGKTPHDAFYKTSVCQVAFFIIASPEFEALHPHFKEAMDEVRKHQSMSVAHEHLFHTVLGIMGIKTPYYDAALDLSNPQVQPYTGPHPSRGGEPLPGSE